MNELIEGVLSVCARFAPDDWSRRVVDTVAGSGHKLAIGLHVTLLHVRGKTVQVLQIVTQNLYNLQI